MTDGKLCGDCSENQTKDEALGHVNVSLQRNSRHRNKRCEHGREKRDCIPCGGSRVCIHQRLKRSCRQCGGSRICEHGNYKNVCKDCGGSGICNHNKIKYSCSICKISHRKGIKKIVAGAETNKVSSVEHVQESKGLNVQKVQRDVHHEEANSYVMPYLGNSFNMFAQDMGHNGFVQDIGHNMFSQDLGQMIQTVIPSMVCLNQNYYFNPASFMPAFGSYPAINFSQYPGMNVANYTFPYSIDPRLQSSGPFIAFPMSSTD